MIYIKNTTDAQVIYIDRETQSIDNITPITLDSNYYTKVEVDAIAQGTLEQSKEYTNNLANEYYDIAEEYIDSNIERLENRIDELENNGGGSSGGDTTELENRVTELESRIYLFTDRLFALSPTDIALAIADLKAGKRVVLNNYDSNSETLFEVIGYEEYEKNDGLYSSISAIKGEHLYVWSTEFEIIGIVRPHTTYLPQIERINEVEKVKVLNFPNGMTALQFNTIFDDFKSKNYKYVLNVGNNDFFNVCSIQDANRSITAIGFDNYEGEMMCYTWFAPQQASVPELTKRRIMTEIF